VPLAILLGLLAAAFYGAADFCGGLATRRSSIFAVTVISQAVGLVLLALALPLFPAHPTSQALEFGALAGVCGGIGLALLYHALSIGKMGVVSPITAVLAAAMPLIVGVARGEQLLLWQAWGIGIALVAVILISLSHEPDGRLEFSTTGVKEAIASGIMLGGFLTFLALAGKGGGFYPLMCARAASTLFLTSIALLARRTLVPMPSTMPIILFAGAIDMTANVLYVLAANAGYLSVAAVLTSLYPASTVFLARIVLGERLALIQKIGVAFALVGVALIAA
jgi:drug/metabolite transporter (DMT)-like permease